MKLPLDIFIKIFSTFYTLSDTNSLSRLREMSKLLKVLGKMELKEVCFGAKRY